MDAIRKPQLNLKKHVQAKDTMLAWNPYISRGIELYTHIRDSNVEYSQD